MGMEMIRAIRDWCMGRFALKEQFLVLVDYAKKEEVPRRMGELINDKGFLTEDSTASITRAGVVKPDGTTIVISADGTISAVGSGGSGGTGPVQLLEEPVNGLGLQFVSPEDIFEVEEES